MLGLTRLIYFSGGGWKYFPVLYIKFPKLSFNSKFMFSLGEIWYFVSKSFWLILKPEEIRILENKFVFNVKYPDKLLIETLSTEVIRFKKKL